MSGKPVDINRFRQEPIKLTVNERMRHNENITRNRVERIEAYLATASEFISGSQEWFKQPLWKRLRWLLFGFYWEQRAIRKAEAAQLKIGQQMAAANAPRETVKGEA